MKDFLEQIVRKMMDPWSLIGFAGQAVFFSRFILQWLASERAKRVVIPVGFWYCSIVGALVTLIYAIHQVDPVIILAQAVGVLLYSRNLAIHAKDASPTEADAS